MAERVPQYPLVPGFNPAMLQHHQIPHGMQQQQQQSQQQQDSHQSIQAFPDPSRNMWSQMQHMQNQYRPQAGGDMNVNQVNQQVTDMLRNQGMARLQAQQAGNFPLGGPQFGGAGSIAGAQSQQPSFHDQGNPPSQGPSHLPPGFPGAGQPHNPALHTTSYNTRTAMLHALQNSQGHGAVRQLELMSMAQNQQNQNGPLNFAGRVPQQPHPPGLNGQQSMGSLGQNDIFSVRDDAALRRSSPSNPTQMSGPPMALPQQNMPSRMPNRPTLAEMEGKANQLKASIAQSEAQLRALHAQRAGMPDSIFLSKSRQFQHDIQVRKDYLSKMMAFMGNMSAGVGQNGPGQGFQGPPNQPGWMQSSGPQQAPFNPNMNQNNPPAPQSSPMQHTMPPPAVSPPSRTISTPQQANTSFSNQTSPNLRPQFPFGPNGNSGGMHPPDVGSVGPSNVPPSAMVSQHMSTFPPPLDRARFEGTFPNFCKSKNIIIDQALMTIEERPIDLYLLHQNVIFEGGVMKVNQKDLWPVIGGKMGFVRFPGNGIEPDRCGPQTAQHLAHVYNLYLQSFDTVYVTSIMEGRRKLNSAANISQQQHQQPPPPPNPSSSLPLVDPRQMQIILGYADITAAELRARKVPEKIIQFVEAHRPDLQRTAAQQLAFQSQIRPPNQVMPIGRPPSHMPPGEGGGMLSGVPPGQQPPNSLPPNVMPNGPQPFMSNPQGKPPSMPPTNFMGMSSQPQLRRPTREQIQIAVEALAAMKKEVQRINLPPDRSYDVPVENRIEFNSLVDQIGRFCQESETKLPLYLLMTNERERIKRLLIISLTMQQQRLLLNSGNPRFLCNIDQLRTMWQTTKVVEDTLNKMVPYIHMLQQQQGGQGGPSVALGQGPNPGTSRQPGRPSSPSVKPNLPSQISPQSVPSPSRPPVNLRLPPPAKNPSLSQGGAANGAPTPPASATTPAANAPTPNTANSPKSPKAKPPPKKAPAKRKSSIRTNATPVMENTQPPSTAMKRPREEEPPNSSAGDATTSSASAANEPSPPKRVKTEWDGPPNGALQKKDEDVENIKTEEDANTFLEQMAEFMKQATDGDSQLTSDINDTLDLLLKSSATDAPDASGIALGLGEGSSALREKSPQMTTAGEDFGQFFDFSSFAAAEEDETGSKAATPDLVSSSSTNPSPESGSEADLHNGVSFPDVKTEEYDPLRLGTLKEIDGGESAYFQSNEWKWDGPMPTMDPAWAVFPST